MISILYNSIPPSILLVFVQEETERRLQAEVQAREIEARLEEAHQSHVAEMHSLQTAIRSLQDALVEANCETEAEECVRLLEQQQHLNEARTCLEAELGEQLAEEDRTHLQDELQEVELQLQFVEVELLQRRASLRAALTAPAYRSFDEVFSEGSADCESERASAEVLADGTKIVLEGSADSLEVCTGGDIPKVDIADGMILAQESSDDRCDASTVEQAVAEVTAQDKETLTGNEASLVTNEKMGENSQPPEHGGGLWSGEVFTAAFDSIGWVDGMLELVE